MSFQNEQHLNPFKRGRNYSNAKLQNGEITSSRMHPNDSRFSFYLKSKTKTSDFGFCHLNENCFIYSLVYLWHKCFPLLTEVLRLISQKTFSNDAL